MDNTYNYAVKGQQRWCDVSQLVYGSPFKISEIIDANPEVPISAIIPDGTVLKVPILETVDVPTSNELLPPWKKV